MRRLSGNLFIDHRGKLELVVVVVLVTAYEVVTIAVLALALVRIAAAVVALDQILVVARQSEPRQPRRVNDPGL